MQCLKCGGDFDPELLECPVCAAERRQHGRINQALVKVEDILLEVFLGVMVVMVLLQILMRNLFQSGIMGADDLVRHLVLWIAFLGAGIATRSRAHVKIDAFAKLIPSRHRPFVDVLINLFSCVICGVLVYASYQFVCIERRACGVSTFLHLPVWVFEMILPVGYLVIAFRFARNGLSSLLEMLKGEMR